MSAETARKFAALEAQARSLMAVFMRRGYEAVAPATLQPAGIYLDAIGESLRARTYVFTDPDGDELCLRPDLTVPVCRLHLERHSGGANPASYCYNGAAFRFQPAGADATHPREFRQAGIESIGESDAESADARTVATMAEALRAAGLPGGTLRFGDLGLFRAVLTAAPMPERWRNRLRIQFGRSAAFRAELAWFTAPPALRASSGPAALLAHLDPEQPEAAEKIVAGYLDSEKIDLIGARTLAEITESLLSQAADARARPLDPKVGDLIESFLAIRVSAGNALRHLTAWAAAHDIAISDALAILDRRFRLMADAGIDLARADFDAAFGRNLDYYTGFVFEILAASLGPDSPVAGGGRYDGLMRMIGAASDVPAVGAAIHTERLLQAAAARN